MCATVPSLPAIAAALILSLTVAGCATQPVAPSTPSSAAAQYKPRAIATTFNIDGRIAARTTTATGDSATGSDSKRGFSGGFSWNHTPNQDVVELLTPLGQIAARVTMTGGTATIELADGQRATTIEPEPYIGRVLGINLPIAALPYWMQGAPVPGVPRRAETDSAGRLAMLWQNGWEIRYADYADPGADAHPTRIDLVQGNIEARIVIAEWKTP